jgi:probable F420-dependent oxidoreductase
MMMASPHSQGRLDVFLRSAHLTPELARTCESLGFNTLWIGGSPKGDLKLAVELLDATSTITIAAAVVNIWQYRPELVAAAFHRVEERHPGRFLLGIGPGHPEVDVASYAKPYDALCRYLDTLDNRGVPGDRRVLGALRPRVLRLAAERTAGAHPYLVTPEHTRRARGLMGKSALLVPVQLVVAESDSRRARDIARRAVARPYLALSNYIANLRALGFTEQDLAGTGSDKLIDALVAHGDPAAVATRLDAHLLAGADRVAVEVARAPQQSAETVYPAFASD